MAPNQSVDENGAEAGEETQPWIEISARSVFEIVSVDVTSKERSAKIGQLVETVVFLSQEAGIFELSATFARISPVVFNIHRDDFRGRDNIVILEKHHNLVVNGREPRYTFNHRLGPTTHHGAKDGTIAFDVFDVRSEIVLRTSLDIYVHSSHCVGTEAISRTRHSSMGPF